MGTDLSNGTWPLPGWLVAVGCETETEATFLGFIVKCEQRQSFVVVLSVSSVEPKRPLPASSSSSSSTSSSSSVVSFSRNKETVKIAKTTKKTF